MENQEKPKPQLCTEEVQAVLDKYGCEIIIVPQKHFGQTVYAPVITEVKK